MLTPAEQLAATKHRKPKKPRENTVRKKRWTCHLRECRAAVKPVSLTLRDVHNAIGMSIAGLCEIEGGTDPQLTTAWRLATFFGKRIEDLWEPLEEVNHARG